MKKFKKEGNMKAFEFEDMFRMKMVKQREDWYWQLITPNNSSPRE